MSDTHPLLQRNYYPNNMAYRNFSFDKLKAKFNLNIENKVGLFSKNKEILQLNDYFWATLKDNLSLALAINTAKAKSELLISPILVEIRRLVNQQISLFSGIEFHVDEEHDLQGTCDFIIGLSSEQFFLVAPIITIVEAKQDNLTLGLPQCIAEMKAAQLFNERQGHHIPTIYGIVTTGSLWKFLKLEKLTVSIDLDEYHIKELTKIMGILLTMINHQRDERTTYLI